MAEPNEQDELRQIVAAAAAEHMKVPLPDTYAFASRVGLPVWLVKTGQTARLGWTEADDALLRRQVGVIPIEQIAAELGRTVTQVDERAMEIGLPWSQLVAGRKAYTLDLAAHLLGLARRVLVSWRVHRKVLVVTARDGEQFIERGELYRLLAVPEIATNRLIDPDQVLDDRLRRFLTSQRAATGKRPGCKLYPPFSPGEDGLLVRGGCLGLPLPLLVGFIGRTVSELVHRGRELILPAEGANRPELQPAWQDQVLQECLVDRQDGRLLPSWKHSCLIPLVEAVVRFAANRHSVEDCRWLGPLFLTWLDFYRVQYPPLLGRSAATTPSAFRRLVLLQYRLLRRQGLDPLREKPLVAALPADDSSTNLFPEEVDYIRQNLGLVRYATMIRECSQILQRLTGDPAAHRNSWDIANFLKRHGLAAWRSWAVGLTIADAARLSGINRTILDRVIREGELATVGKGKYRYIPWDAWFNWLEAYLNQRPQIDEKVISKTEAMKLIGIGETQITRYLYGGILRGYLEPMGKRGLWHVSYADALRVRQARINCTLDLNTPAYQEIREANMRTLKQMRPQAKAPGSPNMRSETDWLPGHLTPTGVARLAGVTYHQVIYAIKAGKLPAIKSSRGSHKIYYAVAPEAARAFAGQVHVDSRAETMRLKKQALQDEGLLTTEMVAKRLGMSKPYVIKMVRVGRLQAHRRGRRFVFANEEVERFAREVRPRKKRTRKEV